MDDYKNYIYYCSAFRVNFSKNNQDVATFDAGERGFSFGEEGILVIMRHTQTTPLFLFFIQWKSVL